MNAAFLKCIATLMIGRLPHVFTWRVACVLGVASLWTTQAWAPTGGATSSGLCSMGVVDLSAYPGGADVPTNFLVPLSWTCPIDASIPGFSPGTFFPELVLEDGNSLEGSWVDLFRFKECPDTRLSSWQGRELPPNRTITVRIGWDGTCNVARYSCPTIPGSADCSLAESCCALDETRGSVVKEIVSFHTGSGPDRDPPSPPKFTLRCLAYQQGVETTTSSYLENEAHSGPPTLDGRLSNRFYSRRASADPSTEKRLATQLGWSLVFEQDPFRPLSDLPTILSYADTWIVTGESVDFAGNVSSRSAPISFRYPEECVGWPSAAAGAAGSDGSGADAGTAGVAGSMASKAGASSAIGGRGYPNGGAQSNARYAVGGGCGVVGSLPERTTMMVLAALVLTAAQMRRRQIR